MEHVQSWLLSLDSTTYDRVIAALRLLERVGPALGRPLVDTIAGSSLSHLKELRPGSTGSSEIRILFAFDPHRRAVLLVAGDKSQSWRSWYRVNVPEAERRYRRHLLSLEAQGEG